MSARLPGPRPLRYSLEDYYQAVSGKGPLAYEWKDKPHRLIYDLVSAMRCFAEAEPSPDDNKSIVDRLRECGIVQHEVDPKNWESLFSLIGDINRTAYELGQASIRQALPADLDEQVILSRKEYRDLCWNLDGISGALIDAGTVSVHDDDYGESIRELTAQRDALQEQLEASLKPSCRLLPWQTSHVYESTVDTGVIRHCLRCGVSETDTIKDGDRG